MSRIGSKPVQIPENVEIARENRNVTVKGPKGTLDVTLHPAVAVEIEDGVLKVLTDINDRKKVALQGLFRSLVANMVEGVTNGYEKKLNLSGIGYRAEIQGDSIILNVGYSNPVNFKIPAGISANVANNTVVTVSGISKALVGQTAAKIRQVRPPESYKGKGIMYADEKIIKKAGKTAAK